MRPSQFLYFLFALSFVVPFSSVHAGDDRALTWKDADALLRQEQEALTAQLLDLKASLLEIEPLVQKAYRPSTSPSNYSNEEFIQRESLFEKHQSLLLSVHYGIGKLAGIFVRRIEFMDLGTLQASFSSDLMAKFESQKTHKGPNSTITAWTRSVLEKVRDRATFFFEHQKKEEEHRLEAKKKHEAKKLRFSALEGLQKQVTALTRWGRDEFENLFWVAQEWPGYLELERQLDRIEAEAQLQEKLQFSSSAHLPQERSAARKLLVSYELAIQNSFKELAAWAGEQIHQEKNRPFDHGLFVTSLAGLQLPTRSERELKALGEKEWEGFCEGADVRFTPDLADRLRISSEYLAKLAHVETGTAKCLQLLE